jgi:hypothetical protein
MELDIESDEEDELNRPLVRNPVVFDIEADGERGSRDHQSDMPRAVHAARNRDAEDVWAAMG